MVRHTAEHRLIFRPYQWMCFSSLENSPSTDFWHGYPYCSGTLGARENTRVIIRRRGSQICFPPLQQGLFHKFIPRTRPISDCIITRRVIKY